MARDHADRPMTEREHEQLQEAMEEQAAELRDALVEDLGGDPEDYRVGQQPVPDGGDADE